MLINCQKPRESIFEIIIRLFATSANPMQNSVSIIIKKPKQLMKTHEI